jgi:predicted secreted Zn-dependent protease
MLQIVVMFFGKWMWRVLMDGIARHCYVHGCVLTEMVEIQQQVLSVAGQLIETG